MCFTRTVLSCIIEKTQKHQFDLFNLSAETGDLYL